MEKINLHNYEAYFLDFSEGNLSSEQIDELNAFLFENPELRVELDEFEIIELPATIAQPEMWSALKKPDVETLRADDTQRDALYLLAIENQLTLAETDILQELLKDRVYKNEFELWNKIILNPGKDTYQKESLYQFGLDRPIADFNYEYYLIARGEGLLSGQQNKDLENFAYKRTNGKRELAIADHLKLQPAQGIFFPNKKSLHKKEKTALIFWLYRAAAVAAILLFGVFIWNTYQTDTAQRSTISKNEIPKAPKVVPSDSIQKRVENSDSTKTLNPIIEPALNEWEAREPDFLDYAEAKSNANQPSIPQDSSVEKNEYLETIDPLEVENLTAENDIPEIVVDSIITIEKMQEAGISSDDNLALSNPKAQTQPNFKTLPELAGDMLAERLSIPDSEKDEMGMILAKRITSKAGELLDAEYKQETSNGDESLTYTLRVGSFSFSRTRSK